MTLVYKSTTVFNVEGSWGHACLHVLSINNTHPSYLALASVPSQQTREVLDWRWLGLGVLGFEGFGVEGSGRGVQSLRFRVVPGLVGLGV